MKNLLGTQNTRNSWYFIAMVIIALISPLAVFGVTKLTPFLDPLILFPLIVILTIIYASCLWVVHNYCSVVMPHEQDMAFQVKAFNDHSLVTIANNDNKVTYANENFLQTTGFHEQDLLGRSTSTFFPESEILLNNEISDAVLRGDNWIGETQIIGKDNAKEVEYELLIDGCVHEVKTQLVQPEGGKSYFISIVRDVSERHVFERTKNDFISTVSHELRTPVTSIKGAIAMVLSGKTGELSAESRGMLDIAHRNADRLAFLVNDILDLEKIAAGQMEFNCQTVDISRLVSDTISANEAYARNFDVTFVTIGIDHVIECYCDSDRVFQVMNNLLSNAAKFSNSGGDVIVTLSQIDERISISVEDFGVGIPQEAQACIFDRFAQADSSDQRAKQGTGLGLSIVKALVEGQNGAIYFESKSGKGTKFSFDLPKRKKNLTSANDEPITLMSN